MNAWNWLASWFSRGTAETATRKNILMLGAYCAGKRSLLQTLGIGPIKTDVVTIGFGVSAVQNSALRLTCYDICTGAKLRPLERLLYLDKAEGLIVVIDSCDRYTECLVDEILSYTSEECLQGKPILVLATKQDLPMAMNTDMLVQMYKLNQLQQPWHIEATSALSTHGVKGLREGLSWLVEAMGGSYRQLGIRL